MRKYVVFTVEPASWKGCIRPEDSSEEKHLPQHFTSLLLTCHQILAEALPVLYTANSWGVYYERPDAFHDWLSKHRSLRQALASGHDIWLDFHDFPIPELDLGIGMKHGLRDLYSAFQTHSDKWESGATKLGIAVRGISVPDISHEQGVITRISVYRKDFRCTNFDNFREDVKAFRGHGLIRLQLAESLLERLTFDTLPDGLERDMHVLCAYLLCFAEVMEKKAK